MEPAWGLKMMFKKKMKLKTYSARINASRIN
jgi:hypothetical protein